MYLRQIAFFNMLTAGTLSCLILVAISCGGGPQPKPKPSPTPTMVPFEIVLNTGYDQGTGMEITHSSPDDNWDLVSWVDTPTLNYGSNTSYGCGLSAYNAPNPPPAPSTPADAVVVSAHDWAIRWNSVLAGPNSRWISVDDRGRPGVAPLEEFVYVYEFTLPSGATSMVLNLDLYADQQATVSLNGNSIGAVPDLPVQLAQGGTSITTSDGSYFSIGKNRLEVNIIETGAYPLNSGCGIVTGFNAVGTVSGLHLLPATATPFPTPLSVNTTPKGAVVTPAPTATPLSIAATPGGVVTSTPTATPLSIAATPGGAVVTSAPTATPAARATTTKPTPTPQRENPDLSIKKFVNSEFYFGQFGSYTFQISNVGQGSASSPITVVDDLPNGFSFHSYAAPYSTDWTCSGSGQQVICTYAGSDILPTGFLPTLIMNVAIDPLDRFPGGSDAVNNCAEVRHPHDINPTNDTTCVTTTVVAQ